MVFLRIEVARKVSVVTPKDLRIYEMTFVTQASLKTISKIFFGKCEWYLRKEDYMYEQLEKYKRESQDFLENGSDMEWK